MGTCMTGGGVQPTMYMGTPSDDRLYEIHEDVVIVVCRNPTHGEQVLRRVSVPHGFRVVHVHNGETHLLKVLMKRAANRGHPEIYGLLSQKDLADPSQWKAMPLSVKRSMFELPIPRALLVMEEHVTVRLRRVLKTPSKAYAAIEVDAYQRPA